MSNDTEYVLPKLSLRVYLWIIFHLMLLLTVAVSGLVVYSLTTIKLPKPPVEFVGPSTILNQQPICPNSELRWESTMAINAGGHICLGRTIFDIDNVVSLGPTNFGDTLCFNWPESLVGTDQKIKLYHDLPNLPPGNYAIVGTVFKMTGDREVYEVPFAVSDCTEID